MNPILMARNLLALIAAKVKPEEQPFGGNNVFEGGEDWSVEIADSNARTHLLARIAQFGTKIANSVLNGVSAFDDMVIAVARELGKFAQQRVSDLKDNTAFRIALEYVTSALFIRPEDVEPFQAYIVKAVALRDAYHAYNGVAGAYSDQAFRGSYADVRPAFDKARSARDSINRLCSGSKHLRALRTTMQARLILDEGSWVILKQLSAPERNATILNLLARVEQTGNEQINAKDVEMAYGQAKGGTLLSAGSYSGVDAMTVVNALVASPFADTREPDGGQRYTAGGLSPRALGTNIAGLRGVVTRAEVTRIGDDTVQITAQIRDSNARGVDTSKAITAPVTPQWARSDSRFLSASAA